MISRAMLWVALCATMLVSLGAPAVAHAQNIVRQPGNHPDYSVEIEPHLAFQWADTTVAACDRLARRCGRPLTMVRIDDNGMPA